MGSSASQPHRSAGLELRKHAIHAADKPPATITMAAMNHRSVLPGEHPLRPLALLTHYGLPPDALPGGAWGRRVP